LREGVKLREMVFGVLSVVGLEQLCKEENTVGFCRCEDGGFGAMHSNDI